MGWIHSPTCAVITKIPSIVNNYSVKITRICAVKQHRNTDFASVWSIRVCDRRYLRHICNRSSRGRGIVSTVVIGDFQGHRIGPCGSIGMVWAHSRSCAAIIKIPLIGNNRSVRIIRICAVKLHRLTDCGIVWSIRVCCRRLVNNTIWISRVVDPVAVIVQAHKNPYGPVFVNICLRNRVAGLISIGVSSPVVRRKHLLTDWRVVCRVGIAMTAHADVLTCIGMVLAQARAQTGGAIVVPFVLDAPMAAGTTESGVVPSAIGGADKRVPTVAISVAQSAIRVHIA